jgi:hypothetical protein
MIRGEEIEAQARALREAVSTADFARAAQSAKLYCQAIRSLAKEVPRPEAARLAAEAQQLLEWARRHLSVDRARLACRLRDAQRLARYCTRPSTSPHTWAIRG